MLVPPPGWRRVAGAGRPRCARCGPGQEYEAWYPVFGASGLVVPTWPVAYGGLDLPGDVARRVDQELRPYNLGRLNPLGLNLAAPALFAHGTEEQRLRFLPPIVRNEETWCQLFSEPGSGSDLASLATRAERDGDDWVITGQKVWTTWAHLSTLRACSWPGRTPSVPEARRHHLLPHRPPPTRRRRRPLRHMGGEVDFNEVFLDGARVPDAQRVGDVGAGWKVANATSVGRAADGVGRPAPGGVDRIGGSGADSLVRLAKRLSAEGRAGGWDDPVHRDERDPVVVRGAGARAGRTSASGPSCAPGGHPGPRAPSARCTRASSTSASRLMAVRHARRRRHGVARGDVGILGRVDALRGPGHAAQPGQHD